MEHQCLCCAAQADKGAGGISLLPLKKEKAAPAGLMQQLASLGTQPAAAKVTNKQVKSPMIQEL